MAKRLKPLLEQEGWTVFLTRTNDAEITLPDRIASAGAHHADIFISLHFNSAAPDTQQAGLETYCLTPTGMPSNLTRGYDLIPFSWRKNFPDNHLMTTKTCNSPCACKARCFMPAVRKTGGVRRARFMGVLSGQRSTSFGQS